MMGDKLLPKRRSLVDQVEFPGRLDGPKAANPACALACSCQPETMASGNAAGGKSLQHLP
jgi:hypothetical protein